MQYVVLYSKSVLLVTLFNGHFTFILYLTGPLIYWYIRSVLSANHRLYKKDLWHLVPMVEYVISVIPYFILPFNFPEVLYGMPRLPVQLSGAGNVPEIGALMEEENAKYIPNFEADYLNKIGIKIDHVMQSEQPYLQIDLNMARFSVMVDVPFHHLSYYFREVKMQSFNDFRNDWRIIHAKKLILEGKAAGLTLEAIGLQSGFTSRISFFLAFKKAEGIAPAEFLAKRSQDSSSN